MSCSSPKLSSRAAPVIETNKDVYVINDSVSHFATRDEALTLSWGHEAKRTTIVYFDTEKPIVVSTGLPPVEAIVTHETDRSDQALSTQESYEYGVTEESKEGIDKSHEVTPADGAEESTWWGRFKQRLMNILLLPVVIIAIVATYKLIKLIK